MDEDEKEYKDLGPLEPAPVKMDVHDSRRKMDTSRIDSFETRIADKSPFGSRINYSGNGVMQNVGLQGNSSHDHIIRQMGAGLYVELGDFKVEGSSKMNNHDYRFVVSKRDILRDCARFVLQHANANDVGRHKKEKRLFAEILEGVFMHFFKMDITEQCAEFLQNDVDSDDEEHSPSPSSSVGSPDPISKIMRKIDVQQRGTIEAIAVDSLEDTHSVHTHLERYFDAEKSKDSMVIYGNRTIYALFRYLHALYARMNYAVSLCTSQNPLYGRYETAEEVQSKYKDLQSSLYKLINQQIDEETFEDECRKLL